MKLKDIKHMKQVKVFGKPYKITWYNDDTPADEGRIGYTDLRTCRIYSHTCQSNEQTLDTLMHEALHIFNVGMQLDLNESDIHRLSSGVTAFLLDNDIIS